MSEETTPVDQPQQADDFQVYSWSRNGELYHGKYASEAEAIAEALSGVEDGDQFFVGRNVAPEQPELWWEASDWLENVSCQDDYAGEWAEDWDDSTKEQRAELETIVRKAMGEWLDRHNLRPRFWKVTNIVEFRRDGDSARRLY